MKKLFLSISCLLLLSISLNARTVITNYENPDITTEDIIECFVEELNKPRYAYGIYDFDVYKTRENQDNVWSVEVSDCSYQKGTETVYGEQVTIFISNGYFSLKTFGGETQLSTIANGIVEAADLNDEEERDDFYFNMLDDLKDFTLKSHKWLKKYDKDTVHSKNVVELCYINYFYFLGFSYEDFLEQYGEYYYKVTKNGNLPDFSILVGNDIYNNFLLTILEMSNYEYSLGKTILDIKYDEKIPKQYKNFLQYFYYNTIYHTDKKQYSYIELGIGTKDSDQINYIQIPLTVEYTGDEIINEDIIKLVAENLGEDVYYEGIFEKYKKEKSAK